MLPPSQAGAFEKMSDQQDERVNDGNHYKGLMSRDDYVRKRTEVGERPKTDDEKLAEVHAIARERVLAERRVKDAAGTDRARVAYKSHTSLTHKSLHAPFLPNVSQPHSFRQSSPRFLSRRAWRRRKPRKRAVC